MLHVIRNIAVALKPTLEAIAAAECAVARRWAALAHKHLLWCQWRVAPTPEHFDHHIDLFYQFIATRNSLWLERGVYGSLALKGGNVLELACGDGFNARNFYSLRSKSIVACDFDAAAIKTAMSKNSGPNVRYVLADIRDKMPEGAFENIVWDAAIEHFTSAEIDNIVQQIKCRLTSDGILSGYTLTAKSSGEKHLSHHEHEFKDKEDLASFLTPHFKNVRVFETIYPERHNLYFWASDGIIPFDTEWPYSIRS